jgi:diguanylate cyclase (GGDEF)-like protein
LSASAFTAMVNPGMSLVFGAAFFLLWQHQQSRGDVALIGASFVALAIAFTFQYFIVYSVNASKLVSNLCFLAGGVGLLYGTLWRFGCKPSVFPATAIAAVGLAVFSWYLLVNPDLTKRIYAINFAFGSIAVLMSLELRKAPRTFHLVDKLLVALTGFWGLTYFIRPIVTFSIEGPITSYENFHSSLYWTTMSVSSSMFLLVFALSLITAIALDVMTQLKQESQTDPLSGLLNRRGLEHGANEMMREAKRKRRPLAVVVCDLDHFKEINDTFGHACGDSVIAAFATCLRGCVGSDHLVARIGGEEFAVVLQGANTSVARLFAESTRTTFSVLRVPSLPLERHLSASFGVAEWHNGESLDALLARADTALYDAKKSGRDRVVIAQANRDASHRHPAWPDKIAAAGG